MAENMFFCKLMYSEQCRVCMDKRFLLQAVQSGCHCVTQALQWRQQPASRQDGPLDHSFDGRPDITTCNVPCPSFVLAHTAGAHPPDWAQARGVRGLSLAALNLARAEDTDAYCSTITAARAPEEGRVRREESVRHLLPGSTPSVGVLHVCARRGYRGVLLHLCMMEININRLIAPPSNH